MACVGFWFAHEIVGYIIPDLEKEIVILSMNRTNRAAIMPAPGGGPQSQSRPRLPPVTATVAPRSLHESRLMLRPSPVRGRRGQVLRLLLAVLIRLWHRRPKKLWPDPRFSIFL